MERESKTEKILAEAVKDIKKELQRRTQEALVDGALEAHFNDATNLDDMVLWGGVFLDAKHPEIEATTVHLILRSDGKLYHVKVIKKDVGGDWEREALKPKELTDEEYLDKAPSIYREVGRLIFLKRQKDKGIGV